MSLHIAAVLMCVSGALVGVTVRLTADLADIVYRVPLRRKFIFRDAAPLPNFDQLSQTWWLQSPCTIARSHDFFFAWNARPPKLSVRPDNVLGSRATRRQHFRPEVRQLRNDAMMIGYGEVVSPRPLTCI
jgi:hypothetical protein